MNVKKSLNKKLSFLMAVFLGIGLFAGDIVDIKVIRNPKPNMEESRYVELVEVGTIPEDLGNDHYLFSPFSLTADKQKNLYVYDNVQARILKLDKDFRFLTAFGRKGIGPGEFRGSASRSPVQIKMGADGNLYASDLRGFNVIFFTTEGKYLGEYHYGKKGRRVNRPLVDVEGNIYIFSLNADRIVSFKNQRDKLLLNIGHITDVFSFLQAKPSFLENTRSSYFEVTLESAVRELPLYESTVSGKLLLYFPNSSLLYVGEQGRILRHDYLWPKDALDNYRELLPREMKKSKDVVKTMFFSLFSDDKEDTFYLQMGRNEEKNLNALYCFDINGRLLKVLYVRDNHPTEFTLFKLKYNGLYLAIKNEKITLYKEEKK